MKETDTFEIILGVSVALLACLSLVYAAVVLAGGL